MLPAGPPDKAGWHRHPAFSLHPGAEDNQANRSLPAERAGAGLAPASLHRATELRYRAADRMRFGAERAGFEPATCATRTSLPAAVGTRVYAGQTGRAEVDVAARSWPMERGFELVSPFGPRDGAFHRGQDFGWDGGSAGRPVYAAQGGYIAFCRYDAPTRGPGSGFGWYFGIDHPDQDGAGFTVYGHCVLDVDVGQRVEAGQRVGHINPDRISNGQVDPHLHFEVLPFTYVPGEQFDPVPWLAEATYPNEHRAAADMSPVWAQILEQQIGPP